jgi:heme-degrading monooxygenase HmoA
MFVILWEYEVKPGCEQSFESVYGSQGEWVQLFQTDPHFRETRLLRDVSRPHCYFTIDYWDSEISYEQFKAANHTAYADIDHASEGFTLAERHVVSFTEKK